MLFRPNPHPGLALFAAVIAVLGVVMLRVRPTPGMIPGLWPVVHVSGIGLILIAVFLLISFGRGVVLDLRVRKDGVLAEARVTSVEERRRRKDEPPWRVIRYAFVDGSGKRVAGDFEEFDDQRIWEPGNTVRIRYSPEEPSIFRIID